MAKRRRASDGTPQEGGPKRPLARDAKPGKSAMKGGRSKAQEARNVDGKLDGKVDGKLKPGGSGGATSNGKLAAKAKGKGEQDGKLEAKGKAKALSTKRRKTEPTTTGSTSFKLVFGTYERLLYGLHCTFPSPSSPLLTPLFSFPAHPSSIRTAVASPSGKHLLTSSTASSALTLWSLRSRRELGSLVPPSSSTSSSSDASVTCVAFEPMGRVVLVGDEHGEIWVYRTKDWALVSRLKGHKGRVNSVAVQKDGRVGLSVGKDRCLRMWDLGGGGQGKGKGKPVASARLGEEGELVKWDLEGQKIAVVTGATLTVYDTTMKPLMRLKSPSRGRIHDVDFVLSGGEQEVVVIGCEDGIARGYLLSSSSADEDPDCVLEFHGHQNRVKALASVQVDGRRFLSTVSSDGLARVFPVPEVGRGEKEVVKGPVAEFDTKGCRPTCLCVVGVVDEEEEEEEEEEEDDDDDVGAGPGGATSEGDEDGLDLDADGHPFDLELGSDGSESDVGHDKDDDEEEDEADEEEDD